MKVGDKLQLSAKVTEGTNKGIVWVSSNPEIAAVDQFGMVTALKEGNVEIAAVAEDGQGAYAICTVTVNNGTKVLQPEDNQKKPTDKNNVVNKTVQKNVSTVQGSNSPRTGDQNGMAIQIALVMLLISAGAMIVIFITKKKFS